MATGGTAKGIADLLKKEIAAGRLADFSKNNICFAFMLEIEALKGKKFLSESLGINKDNIFSLIRI